MQGLAEEGFAVRGMSVSTYDPRIPPTMMQAPQERRNDRMDFSLRRPDPEMEMDDDSSGKEVVGDQMGGTQDASAAAAAKRKRRRSRKGLERKFECREPGCGKSYSRAEHLYRHQLNHDPKEIYRCTFPDCTRIFVRQDLLLRHQERHGNNGAPNPSRPPQVIKTEPGQVSRQQTEELEVAIKRSPRSTNIRLEEIPSPGTMSTISRDSNSTTPTVKSADFRAAKNRRNTADVNGRTKHEQRPPHPSNSPSSLAKRKYSVDTNMASRGEPSPPVGHPMEQNYHHHHRPPNLMHQQHQQHQQHPQHHPGMQHSSTPPYSRPTIQTAITTPNIVGLTLASPYSTQPPSATVPYGPQSVPSPHNRQHPPHAQVQQQQRPPGSLRRSPSTNSNSSMSTPHAQHQQIPTQQQPQQHPQVHHPQNQPHPQHGYPPHGYPPFSHTPPNYANLSATTQPPSTFVTSPPTSTTSVDPSTAVATPATTLDLVDSSLQYTMPVFGGDGYNRSPFSTSINDDFAAWLFGDQSLGGMTQRTAAHAAFLDNASAMTGGMYFGEMQNPMFYPPAYQHPMSLTNIMAPPSPPQETLLSEHRRQELVDIMEAYPDASLSFGRNARAASVRDLNAEDDRVTSLPMMQMYIMLFWQHFHPQLPILHKPTFVADKTPNLLLLSIIAVGAVCVDRKQDPSLAQSASELSTLLAMNLRWQIFDSSDFRPPAKLWVFQSLLLLETFEKMYSTRQLHERAHIHHATTLTLMRRGSSLQGRCALDSPPSVRDDKPGSSSGVSHGSGHSSGVATPDEWWNRWVTSEATKRCAFAAFILDSVHATMFGHSAVMVAHEMRLTLPCDESLWAATSSAEVARVEQTLHNAGVKPTTFLEGLKKTLSGQSVRTNAFGRTVIMAGLLSVSWHMNQRDLQINSLGGAMLGGRDKWRGSLTRAFDLWKVDFDNSLRKVSSSANSGGAYDDHYFLPNTEDVEHENMFESRTVLHHLAHMAMQVDIVDLQIFAGARRLLGRSIGGPDLQSAQRRMREWAPTARARDAVYYALQFLRQVLLPVEGRPMQEPPEAPPGSYTGPEDHLPPVYFARDDYLLNRPWVLYFATLIVWSYGYALDGALTPPVKTPNTPEAQYQDMRTFLRRVGGVKEPGALSDVTDRNQCLGLLLVLKTMFSEMRWELLNEASNLLNTCIDYLVS